jgi:hypothetical protein
MQIKPPEINFMKALQLGLLFHYCRALPYFHQSYVDRSIVDHLQMSIGESFDLTETYTGKPLYIQMRCNLSPLSYRSKTAAARILFRKELIDFSNEGKRNAERNQRNQRGTTSLLFGCSVVYQRRRLYPALEASR